MAADCSPFNFIVSLIVYVIAISITNQCLKVTFYVPMAFHVVLLKISAAYAPPFTLVNFVIFTIPSCTVRFALLCKDGRVADYFIHRLYNK